MVAALEAEHGTVYALDAALRVSYVNPAWASFAAANDGDAVGPGQVLGVPLAEFVGPALWPFYARRLGEVLATGTTFVHEYACDSPRITRTFRLRVTAIDGPAGRYLITHHDLLRIGAADAAPPDVRVEDFREADGLIRECSHCRRTRRVADGAWIWVPQLLALPRDTVSHGLCPACFEIHYPDEGGPP